MFCSLTMSVDGAGGVSGGTGASGVAPSQVIGGAGYSADGGMQVVRLVSGQKATVTFELKDDTSGTPHEIEEGHSVSLLCQSAQNSNTLLYRTPGTIVDATAGKVSVLFTPERTRHFGLWLAALQETDADGSIVREYPVYIQIDRCLSGKNTVVSSGGGLTIGMIRMLLMDFSKDANTLLRDLEFSDAQILQAIQLPVMDWNSTPPFIQEYTTQNFPYTYPWARQVCALLLDMAAHKYSRNRLPHNAGGLTADPNDKSNDYLAKSKMLQIEWKNWVSSVKSSLNMSAMWGATGIARPGSGYNDDWRL